MKKLILAKFMFKIFCLLVILISQFVKTLKKRSLPPLADVQQDNDLLIKLKFLVHPNILFLQTHFRVSKLYIT